MIRSTVTRTSILLIISYKVELFCTVDSFECACAWNKRTGDDFFQRGLGFQVSNDIGAGMLSAPVDPINVHYLLNIHSQNGRPIIRNGCHGEAMDVWGKLTR